QEDVKREQSAERMAREDTIRLRAVILLYFRDQFGIDEFEKLVRPAAGRKFHFTPVGTRHRGVGGSQVAGAISVRDRHYDHFGHPAVSPQELNRACGMAEMRVAVSQIEYGISLL